MTLQKLIKNKPYLLWHVKDLDKISEAAAVEAVLNYGDMPDVRQLIKILGMKKTARIFRTQIKRPRQNYNPKIKNYFKLFFKQYA